MIKTTRVTARFSVEEKRLLAQVATHLHRTNSDTLRLLVLEKAHELSLVQNQIMFYEKEIYDPRNR
jgi:uncharacterized protein (DUF1778 family)